MIEKGDEQALMITINPLQYNPVLKKAVLHSDLIIDVTYNQGISKDDVTFNGWSNFDGTYYTIITTDQFLPILTVLVSMSKSKQSMTFSLDMLEEMTQKRYVHSFKHLMPRMRPSISSLLAIVILSQSGR